MQGFSRDTALYRVTLFFGPEPVAGKTPTQACVFNVKKRSWKAGIQVAVEIRIDQLSALRQAIQFEDRFDKSLAALDPDDRRYYEERISDLFAQAICWCKLNLRLQSKLSQENQRMGPDELTGELNQIVTDRSESILTYIREELDLAVNPL